MQFTNPLTDIQILELPIQPENAGSRPEVGPQDSGSVLRYEVGSEASRPGGHAVHLSVLRDRVEKRRAVFWYRLIRLFSLFFLFLLLRHVGNKRVIMGPQVGENYKSLKKE